MKSGITQWRAKEVFQKVTDANLKAMNTAVMVVERDVKTHFTLQGAGNASPRGDKMHYASLPGQPPAIDTGVLRSSIKGVVEKKALGIIGKVGPDIDYIAARADVGTDVEYGYYLEIGTSKIEPRPYLRPALKRTRRQVEKIFKEANK